MTLLAAVTGAIELLKAHIPVLSLAVLLPVAVRRERSEPTPTRR